MTLAELDDLVVSVKNGDTFTLPENGSVWQRSNGTTFNLVSGSLADRRNMRLGNMLQLMGYPTNAGKQKQPPRNGVIKLKVMN